MYRPEKPIPLKGSTSALSNNLSVLLTEEKKSLNYAVVHKSVVNIVSAATDGSTVTNRHVVCKEPTATQQSTPMIIQAKWVTIPSRTVLVLTSLRGIQVFESDGTALIYWHALGDVHSHDSYDQSNFGRGITGFGDTFLCVGTQLGEILVFNIPAKGTNVTLKESLLGHKFPICDLASQDNKLVSSDEQGNIMIWKLTDNSIKQMELITGDGDPCSTIGIWNDIIVGGFGSGRLKVYCAKSGKLAAVVNAHARWINALDIAPDTGLVVSVSDDTFVKIWQLKKESSPEIEHKYQESVSDLQLVGAQFVHSEGRGFCVTGYDNTAVHFFVRN